MDLGRKIKEKRGTQEEDRGAREHGCELLIIETVSYIEMRVQSSKRRIVTYIFLLVLSFIAFLMAFEIIMFKKFLGNLNETIE